MRTHSPHGGRHELGQNFLVHRPTLELITRLVADTEGAILEIGAGSGALTRELAALGRPLAALEIDERRVAALRRELPRVDIEQGDALRHPFDRPVVVGNVPFHLTTPILRRLLARPRWREAVLLTQWEVARKRASVGGGTAMTAQAAPWFVFALHARVPARGFRPMPSVDGGVLAISRRTHPLIDPRDRSSYERFVQQVFTGAGRGLGGILSTRTRMPARQARATLGRLGIRPAALPRDLSPEQWAALWRAVRR